MHVRGQDVWAAAPGQGSLACEGISVGALLGGRGGSASHGGAVTLTWSSNGAFLCCSYELLRCKSGAGSEQHLLITVLGEDSETPCFLGERPGETICNRSWT